MNDPKSLWKACSDLLRAQVSEAVWLTTFQDVTPTALNANDFSLAVPNSLIKDRIEGRYLALVRDALEECGFGGVSLSIDVARHQAGHDDPILDQDTTRFSQTSRVVPTFTELTDRNVQFPGLNSRYTFEAFVTGTSNRFAHAAALAVAETPARSYNPLFIYGGAGLGKTHLLHAIAHYVGVQYPNYKIRYVSTETFLNEFVDAIRTSTTAAFKRRYREIDVLMIDDIQFMENKEGLQEEFFHTFNHLHGANRQIVISSDRQPDAIATLEDRLRSRFKWGLITDIQPPDIETRLAILRKKSDQGSVPIPDSVLNLIATHITDNIRELEGALIRVSAYASLNKAALTVELAQEVLSDILQPNQPIAITPALIMDAVARRFGFSIEELTGKSRRRPLVTARQVAMYLFRNLTDLSYPAIAREFGGRDHTTVIHAFEKVKVMMGERRQLFDQVNDLIQKIKTGQA